MTVRMNRRRFGVTLAIVAGFACLSASEEISLTTPVRLVATADARVGRPATPMSYAGVAHRTTRSVGVGAGAVRPGVPVGAAVAATRRCAQVVDAYGRIITRCY
jgi:hypothetical protein